MQPLPWHRVNLSPKAPPFPAKAKAVIHIFASGGPSHVDTLDPKPVLWQYADQTLPGLDGLAYPSPFKFNKCGKSGIEVSEVFPKLGQCVDDMTIIRSMWTDIPAHEVAQRFMNTGSLQIPKPSLGSWVVYGLGTENQNMPGFITLGGKPEWRQASFLPGVYQGCNVNYSPKMDLEEVILNIKNQFSPPDRQRRQLDLVHRLNEMHAEALQKDAQLEARIESFEMAFKMQTEATDAFDIHKEPQETRDLVRQHRAWARSCSWPGGWSSAACASCRSRPAAGIITTNSTKTSPSAPAKSISPPRRCSRDLKQRGLLDNTLVIWGGEFGRTVVQGPQRQRKPGPRSQWHAASARGWPAAASRAARFTARRTNSAPAPWKTRCTSTISTRRSCAARLRSHQAHLPLQRPRFPPHGQFRQRRQGRHRLIHASAVHPSIRRTHSSSE